MDRATSKTMDAFVEFVTMEDAMRCAETMLPDVEEPIHIIMDQATSKTMDMFEELVTIGDAMFCVEKLIYVLYLTYLGTFPGRPDARHLQGVVPTPGFHRHEFNSVANKTRACD
ncbi:uncharacterized protein FRV6_07195 [Fusarium oxysporum]|uniref:Uncharacterized protein n=1 Tax=Fusarium oxysporum TaxID=5507 RepID=A0A2H3T2V7_FUSOX|nr:uncharacterized protein FRV6_07195 [Fusarium oxysporum]